MNFDLPLGRVSVLGGAYFITLGPSKRHNTKGIDLLENYRQCWHGFQKWNEVKDVNKSGR